MDIYQAALYDFVKRDIKKSVLDTKTLNELAKKGLIKTR